uniref:Uncharacterized protein n=1 Tax=Romanomermis culicivorax TaxID=13658 RepID=A0A915L104_ROMCU
MCTDVGGGGGGRRYDVPLADLPFLCCQICIIDERFLDNFSLVRLSPSLQKKQDIIVTLTVQKYHSGFLDAANKSIIP